MTYFRHMRRCRAVSVVLGVAWLPYIATRCITVPGAHADCDVLWPSAHAAADHTAPHHHANDALAQPEPQHHHHSHTPSKAPAHTCCDLTGKCNIKVTPGTASLDPVQLVAILPVAVDASVPHADLPPHRGAPALAHAPPTYLRNVTLLL